MQCPALTDIRRSMYQNIFSLDVDFESIIKDNPADVLNWLLGGVIEGIDEQEMTNCWVVYGTAINEMYRDTLWSRAGIG